DYYSLIWHNNAYWVF
nr:immunoglobulin light chain junction region [Macaca mulatta]